MNWLQVGKNEFIVLYSPEAEQDLIEILAYGIERWGEQLAQEVYVKITEQLETLYFFPLSYQS
ncbi:type II toxin-antitoxin system RelE/ParE family toxin [Acinetobacter puyangensis]|uniref:type II toxin-antitoxin system RelE/ParE family toxin n=1 Tax=Acinetobacter puyangensis TaxID=1096779 RepID=UPI003A4D75DF